MADHNELGREGEAFAADYLAAKGYTIVAQNWTYQKAEIDLIVRLDNLLC
jgi:putative endonuclease